MKRIIWILYSSIMTAQVNVYAANPASKEYVDQQDTQLQRQIDNIQPGVIYIGGTGISISGNLITNTQPGITYTAGTGINISGTVITNTQPGITYTAGTGISISGNVISNTTPGETFHVGDYYQGGVIFWLDPTQSYSHGLIADITDKTGTYEWSLAFTVTGATLNGAYQGKNTGTFNTAKILATPGTTYPAASTCATSNSQGFSDWYLPSLMELTQMFNEQMTIRETAIANGGSPLALGTYWSSTEIDSDDAQYFNFSTGSATIAHIHKDDVFRVRCIRAF